MNEDIAVLPAQPSRVRHPGQSSPLMRHFVSLVAALLLASFAPRLTAQMRIAVVDLQRAMNETEDGRRAKARLKRLFTKHQQDLDKRQQDIKALQQDLEQQAKVLSQEARQKRVEDLQKQVVELQGLYVQYQRELAEKEAEMTQQIIGRMEQILRRIGQTEGYTMIVERNEGGVVWMPSNLDLTDVVIQRYNSGEGREADAAGGGAAAEGGAASGGTATGGTATGTRPAGRTGATGTGAGAARSTKGG